MKEYKRDEKLQIFAERLTKRIEELGWSQQYLSDAVNLSPPTISNYVNQSGKPTLQNLTALSSCLGVSTDYLCGMSEDPGDVITERLSVRQGLILLSLIAEGRVKGFKVIENVAPIKGYDNEMYPVPEKAVQYPFAIAVTGEIYDEFLEQYKKVVDAKELYPTNAVISGKVLGALHDSRDAIINDLLKEYD